MPQITMLGRAEGGGFVPFAPFAPSCSRFSRIPRTDKRPHHRNLIFGSAAVLCGPASSSRTSFPLHPGRSDEDPRLCASRFHAVCFCRMIYSSVPDKLLSGYIRNCCMGFRNSEMENNPSRHRVLAEFPRWADVSACYHGVSKRKSQVESSADRLLQDAPYLFG